MTVWNKGLTKETDERVRKLAMKKVTRVECKCNQCGITYSVNKFRADKTSYCGRECYNKSFIGKGISDKNRFKKGHIAHNLGDRTHFDISTGYIRTTISGKREALHRHVWREHYEYLPREYIVHHIDRNKLNNKIENLCLMTPQEHSHIHKGGVNYDC